MSWEPELEELRRREELARRMGGDERVERQHASGRLTVRERIERLLDAGTFHETGALAGRATYRDETASWWGRALQRRGDNRPSGHEVATVRVGGARP
jgi:acetyl-CoA carboxylase carboxyltransferase component